jgi:hypothetical protein
MRSRSKCQASCGSWFGRTQFRHLHPLISDVRGGDADDGQPVAHRIGKHRAQPLHLADRNDDRKPRAFAYEKQVLAMTDAKDVAVPVAESCGGLNAARTSVRFSRTSSLRVHRRTTIDRQRNPHARRLTDSADIERRFAAPFRAGKRGTHRTKTAGCERPRGRRLGGSCGAMPGVVHAPSLTLDGVPRAVTRGKERRAV